MTEVEDRVRSHLRGIAVDVDQRARGPEAAERAIESDRRRRRRTRQRSLVAVGLAAATVAVVVGVSVGLRRPSVLVPVQQKLPSVSVPATPTASPGPVLPTAGPPRPSERTGPLDPAVGVAYPFDLYTHCGIRAVIFGGRDWLASPVADAPTPLPDANGNTSYTGYVAGTMTLLPQDRLRFTITDPLSSGNGQSFYFVPATQPLPLCD